MFKLETLQNFLYTLPFAMAQSACDDCVLLVLWSVVDSDMFSMFG